VSAPEPHRVPMRIWKETGIDVLTVLAAFWVNFAYRAYLAETGTLTIFLVAVALFAIMALLGAVFSQSFMRRTIVMLVASFALVSFFNDTISILLGAASLIFLFLLAGEVAAQREVENGLKIKFFSVAKAYLRKLITAIVLLVVIFLPKFDPVTQEPLISSRFFDGVFDASITIAGGLYPEIKFGESLQHFLESDATLKVANNPDFAELTPSQQKLVISESVRNAIVELQKSLGKTVDPTQPLRNFIFDFTKKTMGDFVAKTKQWVVITWVVALFFTFRGIGIIFYWMVACFAFLVYQLLLAFKFAKIIYESKQHESIDLT